MLLLNGEKYDYLAVKLWGRGGIRFKVSGVILLPTFS